MNASLNMEGLINFVRELTCSIIPGALAILLTEESQFPFSLFQPSVDEEGLTALINCESKLPALTVHVLTEDKSFGTWALIGPVLKSKAIRKLKSEILND